MIDLKLEADEGILKQTTNVERYKSNDEYTEIYEMYLTNKNLILIYEKSNGFFSKAEDITEKIPLENIKVINNKVQVFQNDDNEYGLGLQILYKNGTQEHLVFEKKKEIQQWNDLIVKTILGEKVEVINKNETRKETTELEKETNSNDDRTTINTKTSTIFTGIKKVVDSAKGTFTELEAQVIEDFREEPKDNIELDNQKDIEENIEKDGNINKMTEKSNINKYIYCSSCGEKINANSKFCNFCGNEIGKIEKEDIKQVNNNEATKFEQEEITERKTIYEGKIYKCPNCGEVLKSFTTNCPTCGYELRGSKSASAVSELATKLEAIESKRENVKGMNLLKTFNLDMTISKTDEQKISLIRSFVIPNTKEDLYEFLILSKSNVEIDLYENTQLQNARLAVSDAWKAKFEQAYQKAKLLFKDDERMTEIQAMYDEVNKSIKNAKTRIWRILGIVYGVIFAFVIIILSIVALSGGFSSDNNTNNNDDKTSITEESVKQDNDTKDDTSETDKTSNGAFNEKEVIKNLKVKEYKVDSYGSSGMVLVIENNNDYDIHLKANIEFYDKNKELIGVADNSIAVLDKKTTSLMSFWNDDDFESVKYEFSASENDYYKAGVADISYTSKRVKNKEIISVTNNGKDKVEFVEGKVLFFENDKLVKIESTYFDNNGTYLEPGKTVTKEIECYDCDYDSAQIYFTGRVEK